MSIAASIGRAAAAAWLLAGAAMAGAAPCPADRTPPPPGTLLTVFVPGREMQSLDAAALAALPRTTLTQRQSLASDRGGNAAERSLAWSGVLLRDLLVRAGYGDTSRRGDRFGIVEAIATDGYRAVFSWGELFNHPLGEQVLVVTTLDGVSLDEQAGPLALRALADLRPGPRHVRNLCALRVELR